MSVIASVENPRDMLLAKKRGYASAIVVEDFPKEPTLRYNLACYACQLNRLDEARQWLGRAREIGDADEINRMALADEDLKPLWPEIAKPKSK